MYTFDFWLDNFHPEIRTEFDDSKSDLTLWDWIDRKHPEILRAWKEWISQS